MRTWNSKQIKDHETAAQRLGLIKNEVIDFIAKNSQNVYEKDVVLYIKKAYARHGLTNDDKKEFAIVAFGINTKEVHYFPKGKGLKLTPNTLILLDIWARLSPASHALDSKSMAGGSPADSVNGGQARLDKKNAPYADTTFMFYHSKKIPKEIQKTWDILVKSRDNAINYIKKKIKKGRMPRGLDIDRIAHDTIGESGLARGIKHTVGHSLGFGSPHGKLPGINWREYSPILHNVGYTIEPGVYLEKFGMRTEIDFYINRQNQVIVTTPLQKDIEII